MSIVDISQWHLECTDYAITGFIIRLFRMFPKSSVDLNGPPQRSTFRQDGIYFSIMTAGLYIIPY